MNLVETPTRRKLPRRIAPIVAIVVHQTGQTDLAKCLAWYTAEAGEGPHYLVTAAGVVHRFTGENRVAWHAAIKPDEQRLYRQGWATWSRWIWPSGTNEPVEVAGEFAGYRSWRERWRPRIESPLDLPTGKAPNYLSIGIEVQSLEKPTATVFNPVQYTALGELIRVVAMRNGVPIDRDHILGHQDVCPLRRTNPRGGTDPGDRFDWDHLWSLVRGSQLNGGNGNG